MAKEDKNENQIDEKTTKNEVKSSSVKKPRINSLIDLDHTIY